MYRIVTCKYSNLCSKIMYFCPTHVIFRQQSFLSPHSDVFIEFHCLLSAQQWGFDDSSEVRIYFGETQVFCGPMATIKRYVCSYIRQNNV